ncbi:penicillin-binding protein 2 [Candidatus Tisiphia endosymbiont of Sialis lutaria]|uniref:peptidoglycan D,D-transpeptidase FtsI family protein n=1 Tax=Candidatus Tisiphia endosymbiont of Sialis lutaria TaxID=2029164 RepID=UPI00312C7620
MKRSFSNIILWDICADNTKIRLFIVSFCFAVFFCGLSYRLIIVATNGYVKPEYQVKSSNFRKEIVDRNGNLLAVNLPSSSLFVNPQKVINPEQSLERLSKILPEIDKTKLLAELKGNKSFVWVKRDLLPKEQEAVLNLAMPGFSFEQEQKRIYTFSNLLSHVIGYVGRDLAGLAGLERSYDKFLTNSDFDLAQPEQLKKPLELSIDVRLQNILNEEIDKTLNEFSAIGAVGIIANPNNGEILALISKPDFNPHYPSSAKPEELFNMASLGIYEMGSVFKTLTMAVGFDTDAIAMNDAYDISYMKVGAFNVKDYHPRHGWHSVPEIFLHSSNIGVSQIMLEVGKNDFKKYLKRLGLLDQLKIELPERGTPLFPSDKRWSDLTSVVMSYGYGISISPLHFMQAVLPVVNGGTLYDLTLIKRQDERLVGTKVFSEKTSKQMSELFRLVVKEGTGRRADVKGYLVGGKTGTAEKLKADGHGKRKYLKNSRISSFLGLLPASNPQYVIFIMFDEPKGTKESFGFATAGWTAAPTVGRVLERMVSLYGIEPIEKGEEL